MSKVFRYLTIYFYFAREYILLHFDIPNIPFIWLILGFFSSFDSFFIFWYIDTGFLWLETSALIHRLIESVVGRGEGGGSQRWLHVDSCPEKWVILIHIIISYCQNSWLWINHCAFKTPLDPFVTQLRLLVPFADEGYERRLAGLSWTTHQYIAYHLSNKQLFVYVY